LPCAHPFNEPSILAPKTALAMAALAVPVSVSHA
jgi:hypothetical protein